ncbi:MAG: glucokinase [Pirellulaceae bacterium]|jgi:glucokinase
MSQTTIPDPNVMISRADAALPLFIGVDVGGTNIKIGVVDDHGRTLGKTKIPTEDERGVPDAIARIVAATAELMTRVGCKLDDVKAIGLGTPGPMDIPNGMILVTPNLPGWRNFPIRDKLSEAFQLPVSFSNDANAAAYGEFWIGSGREHKSMIMLTLGTGVGGGIILDGRSIEGTNSFGSECGHIIIDSRQDARLCVWGGGRGQLEAYASASALTQRTKEELQAGRTSSLVTRLKDGAELSPLLVSEEGEKGDLLCIEIVLETARYLGIGITTLVHTVDPGSVVLGGAMNFGGLETELGRKFLEEVRSEFRRRAFDVVQETTHIEYAVLGGDAGYIGAAGVARHDSMHATR